jgi:methionine sulfoxide reductase heme-binding subunit
MSPVSPVFRPSVIKLAKVVLFLGALVPQALLIRGALIGDLGVNPAETIQLETGRWAFKFLLLSLAVTPVRRITGWNPIIQFRRMLGLFAFFYAFCHFAAYWSFDLGFAFAAMIGDVLKRPFIAFGFAALLLMLPLALTSTRGWIRRMGKRWTQLHRLVYVAAVLAALHFALKVKVFTGDPVIYAAIVTVLLGFRVVWYMRKRERTRPAIPQP